MAVVALLAVLLLMGEAEADTTRYNEPTLGRSMLPKHDLQPSAHSLFNSDLELLTQPLARRADERASRWVEHRAATQEELEPKEITIYISGEYKAVVLALLGAVDKGTLVTEIADFDSLSATYGLMEIYRKSRKSSGFYGHRFRLTFPPPTDVASIIGAYGNLSYIQSVEPEPPPESRVSKWVATMLTIGALTFVLSYIYLGLALSWSG